MCERISDILREIIKRRRSDEEGRKTVISLFLLTAEKIGSYSLSIIKNWIGIISFTYVMIYYDIKYRIDAYDSDAYIIRL